MFLAAIAALILDSRFPPPPPSQVKEVFVVTSFKVSLKAECQWTI